AAATVAGSRVQAAQIIELVDRCLRPLHLTPAQLSGIVVGDGPGSFTGLRIGWAAAKGLAQERGLRLVAVPSLLAAAAGAAAAGGAGAGPVAAWFDALRGQVFGALYLLQADRVETFLPPTLATPEQIVERAPARARLVVGDGAVKYAAAVERWSGARPIALDAIRPGAVSLLLLVERAGRSLDDVAVAEPDYGRPAEAQVKWAG